MTTAASLTVDLAAIAANWRALAKRAPRCETAAVVKADAYGLGMIPVAQVLHQAGCKTFFVAHVGEAIALRTALHDVAIYVLHGIAHANCHDFSRHHLKPVLNSINDINVWTAAIASGMPDPGAAVHVDTGMSRLGIDIEEFTAFAARPLPFTLALLLSHFVESELPHSPVTQRQLADFARLRASLPQVPASLANSSGVFIDAAHHELNRPGFALYGGNPTPNNPNPMLPVVTLRAPLLHVQRIAAGATAGYCGTFTAKRPTTLATFALGYADGWLRSGSNRASAMIGGARCPLVGNISMDLTIADVTDVPAAALASAAQATLIGDGLLLDDVAAACGTIGYEVLTRFGNRLARHYVNHT